MGTRLLAGGLSVAIAAVAILALALVLSGGPAHSAAAAYDLLTVAAEPVPDDIAVGPDGSVYVNINNNHRVVKYSAEHTYLTEWDVGEVSGGIAVGPDGSVYVNINNNHRVVKYSAEGEYLTEWDVGAEAKGLAVGPDGSVYVNINNNHRVVKYDADGGYLAEWDTGEPADGIAVGPDGSVYVNINNNHRVVKYDANGTQLATWDLVAGVIETNGIAVGPDGSVYVNINNNHRVVQYSSVGELLADWSISPLEATFNYQGYLVTDDGAVDDNCDFQFSLWDDVVSGTQLGTQIITGVAVSNGNFNVDLDFDVFDGEERFMEIAVQCGGDSGYVPLDGRLALRPTPYSLFAQNVPWEGITNVPLGFADGDDDTTYSAGAGLVLSGTVFSADMSYLQARYDNIIDVAPAGGDATDLAGAVALVSNSGPTNTYLIRVAPGVYTGNVTLPPYVHLRGSGVHITVISTTLNNTSGLLASLVLSDSDELSELTVVANGPLASEIAAVESGGEDVWMHHVEIQAGGAYTSYGLLVDGGHTRLSDFEVEVSDYDSDSNGCGIAIESGSLTGLNGRVQAAAGRWAAAVRGGGESLALLRDVWGSASATTSTFGIESGGSYFTLQDVSFEANGSGNTYGLYLSGGDVDVSDSDFVASGGMAYGVYVPVTATGRIANSDIAASGWVEEVNGIYNGQGASLTYEDVRVHSSGNQWRTVGMAVYKAAPVLRNVSIEAGSEGGGEETSIGLYLDAPTGGVWQDLFIVSQAITDAYGIYVQSNAADLEFEHAVVEAVGYNARATYLYGGGELDFAQSDLLAESTGATTNDGSMAVVEHDTDVGDWAFLYVDSSRLRTTGAPLNIVISGTISTTLGSPITYTQASVGGSLLDGELLAVDATCAGAYNSVYQALDNQCR